MPNNFTIPIVYDLNNPKEKNFFHKVKQKITIPNIFFVINRWDLCQNDAHTDLNLLKQQHLSRCTEFMIKELGFSEFDEKKYVFFISADKVLNFRIDKRESMYKLAMNNTGNILVRYIF